MNEEQYWALTITVAAGLIIWIVKAIWYYRSMRNKLVQGLIADINLHISGAQAQKTAAVTLVHDTIKEGKKVPFPVSYNVGEYYFRDAIQRDLPNFLKIGELLRVIKFYQHIWEIDVAINGLATTLGLWWQAGHVLTEGDIAHLGNRAKRIVSLCDVRSTPINYIVDLPEDYGNKVPLENVMRPVK